MRIAQRGFNNPLSWLTIAFILSLLVSCSSKPENAIVGKWSEIDGTETMEFFKDGTLMVGTMGMNLVGTYKFVDKDRIKVEVGVLTVWTGPLVETVSISGNELTEPAPKNRTAS